MSFRVIPYLTENDAFNTIIIFCLKLMFSQWNVNGIAKSIANAKGNDLASVLANA